VGRHAIAIAGEAAKLKDPEPNHKVWHAADANTQSDCDMCFLLFWLIATASLGFKNCDC